MVEVQGKLEKKIRSFFRRDLAEPNNLSYPNKYMRPDFDPQVELKDIATEMPGFLWSNTVVSSGSILIVDSIDEVQNRIEAK